MAPIAAGQYYWVYVLAAPKWKIFCSYVIGWLTSLAWVATVATECLFAGTILQGLVILDNPDYDAKLWQGTMFAWAVTTVCVLVNAVVPGMLPKFEIFIIVFHLAGFVAIIAVLWYVSVRTECSPCFMLTYTTVSCCCSTTAFLCLGSWPQIRAHTVAVSRRGPSFPSPSFHKSDTS
jgi:choline transport protein